MPSDVRSPTRRRLLVTGLVLLLLVAGAVWIGVRALAAQRHLEAARDQIEVAQAAATDRRIDDARTAITAAGRETEQARALTGDPVWAAVAAVPWAGATLKTARGLVVAADDLAREVVPAALDGAEQADPDLLRRPDGSIDLELLHAVTPNLVAGADGVTEVQADLAQLPERGVIGQVADARAELVEQVNELAGTLRGAAHAVQLAPVLLGEDRPRRYVLLVQQTAEPRGTGGLPGGWAVMEADQGRLRIVQTGTNADAPDGPIAVPAGIPDDFRSRYRGLGAFDLWVNVNVSPDLPNVARVIAQRFREKKGLEIDGVVALDAQALAMMLEGGEPVQLADGTMLPVDQLVEYLAVGQYADFVAGEGRDILARADERREALAAIGVQAALRLTGGHGSGETIVRGLSEAVRTGHLRMASDDPALALLAESGVDGALPSGNNPTAYPVVFNSSGGKLDHFLDRSVRYEADECDGGRRNSRITVTLANRAPEGLPPYVAQRQTADGYEPSNDSAVTLVVYTAQGTTLRSATLDGVRLDPADPTVPFLSRFVEGGLPAWTVPVELPRGQERTFVLELDEVELPGQPVVAEQPLSRPLVTEVDVPVCG